MAKRNFPSQVSFTLSAALALGACTSEMGSGDGTDQGESRTPDDSSLGGNQGSTDGDGGAQEGALGSGGTGSSPGSGGTTETGGFTSASSGGTSGDGDLFPCDGTTSGYDVVVSLNGTEDARAPIQAALDSLSEGRTTQERVLVQGSGTISANARISIPSHTLLNVCGTLTATGTGTGDMAPLYARGKEDITIPHVTIAGPSVYAMFFRNTRDLTLGQIEILGGNGLGIRIDNHGGDRAMKVQNIRIEHVYVENTGGHGVETYGVNALTIGSVIARDTGDCGLLLNDTTNATVGLVDAEGAGTGTGYAAFRMANRNGRVGDAYPTNIVVDKVVASGGGRGVFCVSESGGALIKEVQLSDTGNNSVLIENCTNVEIASGTVSGGGDVRLAARDEFPNNSQITFKDLAVSNTNVVENPCATSSTFDNVTVTNGNLQICN